jgi:hypothetical protein
MVRPGRNQLGNYPDPDFLWATTNPRGDRTATAFSAYRRGDLALVRLTLPEENFERWPEITARYPLHQTRSAEMDLDLRRPLQRPVLRDVRARRPGAVRQSPRRAVRHGQVAAQIKQHRLAAARQARTRERQRLGLVSYSIDVHEHRFAAALINSKRLSPEETARKALVVRALADLVEDFIARWPDRAA